MGKFVLTYHMWRLEDWTREGADLLGLRSDLGLLIANGVPIRSLDSLMEPACTTGVAITFDDGTRMDAEPIDHPRWGRLPSALSILAEFAGAEPAWRAASFVIASPVARAAMASNLATEYGPDFMHERWWAEANASGLMDIENHSWDHNHPQVARSVQRDNIRGTFENIETHAECEAEVSAASDYIERVSGRRPRYFAYPFGQSSEFLRREFLPSRAGSIGLRAAFSTEPRGVNDDGDPWHVPRFVSGHDWNTDDGLRALVDAWI